MTIPTNAPGISKTIEPSKKVKYLGVWLNSCLNFIEHVQKSTTKAITAAHSLRLLGNSIQGMHQLHARQLYIGAIIPVATYSLPVFWKSKGGKILNLLTSMQNRCLQMTTRVFHTRNTTAMEIEASIPPINLWLEYKLDMEALHISRLAKDHLIYCHTYLEQRENQPLFAPPPLPVFDQSKNTRGNPRSKFTTCIMRVSRWMLDHTKCMEPHLEMPWRRTGHPQQHTSVHPNQQPR